MQGRGVWGCGGQVPYFEAPRPALLVACELLLHVELVQRFGEHHHLSPPFRLHRLRKLPNEGQHGVAPA